MAKNGSRIWTFVQKLPNCIFKSTLCYKTNWIFVVQMKKKIRLKSLIWPSFNIKKEFASPIQTTFYKHREAGPGVKKWWLMKPKFILECFDENSAKKVFWDNDSYLSSSGSQKLRQWHCLICSLAEFFFYLLQSNHLKTICMKPNPH